MARPRLKIDTELLEKLAQIHCTSEEAAAILNCSKDTLEKRYSAVLKRGREKGLASLKRRMWDAAVNEGNTTMMIWLSKQYLGMSDQVKQETTITHQVYRVNWADEVISDNRPAQVEDASTKTDLSK